MTNESSQTYKCRYCGKDFKRESTLTAHLCEQKRRHQQQSETGVQWAYKAYIRFYEISQGSAKLKTYDDFADSAYYKAFVKFGRYCHVIRAINPEQFVKWVLKQNKKIDHWCKDSLYTEYLTEYMKSRYPKSEITQEVFDDDTIREMYAEVNSKYVEWQYNEEE